MMSKAPPSHTAFYRLGGRKLYLVLLWLLLASRLHGHSMPQSLVQLDFLRDSVSAELTLPMNELELSFKQPLLAAPAEVPARYGPALRTYIAEHIHPVAPDGRVWSVEVEDLGWKSGETGLELSVPDVIARVTLRPPAGAPLRVFTLHYSVICHEVMSHTAAIVVRHDWNSGTFSKPEPVGFVQFTVVSVQIDRTQGSFWQGFRTVFLHGMRHIAEGWDHLLFLFVLLLPAPLVVASHRWGGYRGIRPSLSQLLKVVTAFTIGHSLTLIVAGAGWVRLPSQPVEVLIAVSILVSAIHAIRPWFAGREPWIAAGFGLIHGLAFASSIAEFGFSPFHLAVTIFGFNLGIEVMQLLIVAVVSPLLILGSKSRFYPQIRVTGATLAALAALYWIGARMLWWGSAA